MDSITAAAAAAIPVTEADALAIASEQATALRLAAVLARAAHGHLTGRQSKPRQADWYRQREDELAEWLAGGGFRAEASARSK
ncbi:MAG: hypothetical protein ACXU8N_14965 [Telluria sp.]